ncbi:uncharacterized protein SETTUDRAFT_96702 [Exserohilum turcica Et28A]|uniref:EthD domain-containing protein n=1 Tax=Exserohilum turcicum (strain 28A) TaxID=671987 RepID=R0IBE1_EXST2|nr:uncharacterized protein SETTUDRAFT_96702 [Exserohilum turcica Et28A]EOA82705.1 hypothetical protein SETTUDRAFT_96702 [Exserohilum turcica Et28A]
MTYTTLIFLTRKHNITSEQFRDYYEGTHIPLVHSLLAHCWPVTFKRRYIARTLRKGFGTPANPDRPPLTLRGEAGDMDYDCITETTFESEAHFLNFYRSVYAKEVAEILTNDEANFLESGKTKIIVVGETWTTDQSGMTARAVACGLMSVPPGGDDASS